MKNNLYLVQFNHSYGKGLIMPYSVGVLWSYANQFSSIKKSYKLKDIICIRDEPDAIVDAIERNWKSYLKDFSFQPYSLNRFQNGESKGGTFY